MLSKAEFEKGRLISRDETIPISTLSNIKGNWMYVLRSVSFFKKAYKIKKGRRGLGEGQTMHGKKEGQGEWGSFLILKFVDTFHLVVLLVSLGGVGLLLIHAPI